MPALLLGLTTVWTGCGDPVAGTDEEESGAETGPVTTGDPGGSTGEAPTTTMTTGEATTGEATTGEPFLPFLARGDVKVARVEANPGVAILLEQDGVPVSGADRNAYLPKGRNALLRAFLDVPDDWTPRALEVRLELSGGGVEKTLSETFMIEGDTLDNDFQSGPYFGLVAADMVPGLKYRVSVWEAAPGQEALPEASEPPVSPQDGPAYVGVESGFAEMRVVLVPVDYAFEECAAVVDGEAHRQSFEDALYQQNGLESLELVVHAPYEVRYSLGVFNGLSQLVGEMSQLRAAEDADPNVYYYALFDNCGRCIGAGGSILAGCTVGLAFDITGPDMADAYARAAAGQLNGSSDDTFVHEIGHTQGRRHIECAGAGTQAAGIDETYPYGGGVIEKWGFGIRDYRLRHPKTHADYMSYCGQTWASDWQWNATYKRILELSSWSMAGPPPSGPGQLIGTIEPDGSEMWWTVPGEFQAARAGATHTLHFDFADGEVTAPAEVRVRPDAATKIVVTGLPAGFDGRALTGLRVRDERGERPIAPGVVRWLHRPGTAAAGSPR